MLSINSIFTLLVCFYQIFFKAYSSFVYFGSRINTDISVMPWLVGYTCDCNFILWIAIYKPIAIGILSEPVINLITI